MNVLFESSFERDLRRITNKEVKISILQAIQNTKISNSLREIKNLKKLRSFRSYYRIKIGDYRIGLELLNNSLIFVRCLHRKDIYKYFP